MTRSTPTERQSPRASLDEADLRVGIEREIVRGCLNRVRVVVDADHVDGAEQAGGDRQHPGAGADVDHRPVRSRSSCWSAARQSRVVAWWPVPKPIDGRMTMTIVDRSAGGTSHGGATMMFPTRTARRLGLRRAAQSSSGTSIGSDGSSGNSRAQRSRGAVAFAGAGRKNTRQASGVALVDRGDVEVDERGLQEFRRVRCARRRRRPDCPAPASCARSTPKMSLTRSKRPLSSFGARAASARTVSFGSDAASCSSSFFCSCDQLLRRRRPSRSRAGRRARGRRRRACPCRAAGTSCRSACLRAS